VSVILLEILLVLLLVLANGLFSMSEMAVVSARRARLQYLANQGNAKARIALDLASSPDRFLSTIQIGITSVGILAGAIGGATIAEQLGALLSDIPTISSYSEAIGVGIVVLSITYLSLVLGELVPKRLALNDPERVASVVAKPMRALSIAASPLVKLLEVSTQFVFKVLRIRQSSEPPVTEEEIKVLIEQATKSGIFKETEQYMVKNVFRLEDKRVSALMTTRLDTVWLDIDAPFHQIRQKTVSSHYSRFPVCKGNLDNVVGIVKAKELLAYSSGDDDSNWKKLIRRPLFIPESRSALDALESFKKAHLHIALIIDEYGAVEGLVTTNDILEAIVGDITSSGEVEGHAVQREDGSWLLEGTLPLDDLKEILPVGQLPGEERGLYQTLAGFMMTYLGRVPSEADSFEWRGIRFEVVDMDGKRVDKVLVTPLRGDDI
jgi:putative hemolysin